jgi:two-component system sensor histidine kinase GlrK
VVVVAAVIAIGVLSRRLVVLRRENNLFRHRMIEVDEMKKAFISHVSHELKAPLASMQETTHLILERIPGPLTDKQQRLLELNMQCGKRLATMLGNMLDLSRLEAGIVEYEMQSLDIGALLNRIIVDLNVQAQDKTQRITTDIQPEPLIVECDPDRMAQAFINLIENALRFSKREGVVTVHARFEPNLPENTPGEKRIPLSDAKAGFALIAVSDSGPGIEDEHKQKVFETFHQVKRGKKAHGQSLGLGLAISRFLVEAHQGYIWIDDNPNGGSVFFVLLPLAAAKAKSLKQAS